MKLSFWIFYLLDLIICAILSFLFVYYYVSKKVPKYIVILCRLCLFANYLLIFTLPYEIVYFKLRKEAFEEAKRNETLNISSFFEIFQNNSNETNNINFTNQNIIELEKILTKNYGVIFWVLVTFSNFVIGSVFYYQKSGEFTFWRKVWDAIINLIKMQIFSYIFIGIIFLILQNLPASIMIYFGSITFVFALIYLGISIIKIPRNMFIHSNYKLSLEYYEFKANKKSKELKKNKEELKKMYFKGKQTLEYITKIEEYLEKKKKNKDSKNENNEKDKKDENNEKDIKDENNEKDKKDENNENNEKDEKIINIIEENSENVSYNENINNEEKEKEENDDEKNKKEKERKKIEKDYRKHKDIIKYKKYVEELFSNLSKIIKNNKIETENELNEEPIKDYSKIVSTNEKSKELDADNERLNSQIQIIYKHWSFIKDAFIEDKFVGNNNFENDANESLSENEYLPTMKHSERKINFYRKYNKPLYISLMIFFIVIDILIVISETSLIMPVNLSIFSLIFKNISNPLLIHIFCILYSSLFFLYTSYSFGKIKSFQGLRYLIFAEKQTNALGLLSYCQKLSSVSFPVSLNIIRMIFYSNVDDNYKASLEQNYGDKVNNVSFYGIIPFIPQFLIFVVIFYFYDIKSIFKKKKISFYIKNENRRKYILEGKEYLMEINKSNF